MCHFLDTSSFFWCFLESTNHTGGVLEALCVWEENWQFVSHIQAILPLLVQTHYKLQVQ